LPREFLSIFLVAVYLPLQTDAGTKNALNELRKTIRKQEHAHPSAALLVAGNFNAGKRPFYLMLHMQQEGKQTLDHLYSTNRDAHKALPRHPFCKSDHYSILPISAYKPKLMQEGQVTRSWPNTITTW
jgi:hypothetical protein